MNPVPVRIFPDVIADFDRRRFRNHGQVRQAVRLAKVRRVGGVVAGEARLVQVIPLEFLADRCRQTVHPEPHQPAGPNVQPRVEARAENVRVARQLDRGPGSDFLVGSTERIGEKFTTAWTLGVTGACARERPRYCVIFERPTTGQIIRCGDGGEQVVPGGNAFVPGGVRRVIKGEEAELIAAAVPEAERHVPVGIEYKRTQQRLGVHTSSAADGLKSWFPSQPVTTRGSTELLDNASLESHVRNCEDRRGTERKRRRVHGVHVAVQIGPRSGRFGCVHDANIKLAAIIGDREGAKVISGNRASGTGCVQRNQLPLNCDVGERTTRWDRIDIPIGEVDDVQRRSIRRKGGATESRFANGIPPGVAAIAVVIIADGAASRCECGAAGRARTEDRIEVHEVRDDARRLVHGVNLARPPWTPAGVLLRVRRGIERVGFGILGESINRPDFVHRHQRRGGRVVVVGIRGAVRTSVVRERYEGRCGSVGPSRVTEDQPTGHERRVIAQKVRANEQTEVNGCVSAIGEELNVRPVTRPDRPNREVGGKTGCGKFDPVRAGAGTRKRVGAVALACRTTPRRAGRIVGRHHHAAQPTIDRQVRRADCAGVLDGVR